MPKLCSLAGSLVFFWFIATAVLSVRYVFQDPKFDYRFLIVGALIPDVVDVFFGGARVLHTLVFSVALLVVVMLLTRAKRAMRRQYLPLAIGTFIHLVFDGAFTKTKVFWWPFGGFSFDGASLPVADRMTLNILLEVVGLVLVIRLARQHGLGEAGRRREFFRTGVLSPINASDGH